MDSGLSSTAMGACVTPKHYHNYANKYGVRTADKRQRIDDDLDRQRRDQEIVNNKTWGMGCNE